MIPKNLVPPEPHSQLVAHKALRPLRPHINGALPKLVSGLTAREASLLFSQLDQIGANIKVAYDSGTLDGSEVWKGKALAALIDLGAISEVVEAVSLKYTGRRASLVASEAAKGNHITDEQAQSLTEIDQEDLDSIVSAINGVLEL